MMPIDTYKHQGMRKKLVEELKTMGINDSNVLAAINKVPRHWFLDSSFLEIAYTNKAFPIGAGQTISQPYTVAYQSQLLAIKKYEKVLEIGTGSGYQTCILMELGANVFSIERQKALFDKTKPFLTSINYKPHLFYGDGYIGLPQFAPFDKVIVTAGAPYIPEDLLKQLKINGMMVIPVGDNEGQVMNLITRKTENEFERVELDNFRFVPLLENRAK